MKASLCLVAACLLFTTIAAQRNAVDRLVARIQKVVLDLEACQKALATTTPQGLSTTEEFDFSSTTPDGMGESSSIGSFESLDMDKRQSSSMLKNLRKQLRYLQKELKNCNEALDD